MATKKQNNEAEIVRQKAEELKRYVALAQEVYFKFLRAHANDAEGGISPCTANLAILEKYCDDNVLACDDPQSWEISLLAVGSQLAREKNPVLEKPAPAPPPAPTRARKSEQQELRDILAEHKGDPKTVANIMRAKLKTKDVHAAEARSALPAKWTKRELLRLPASDLRELQRRYSAAVLNDRLNGRS